MLSKEGTKPGDPTVMAAYSLSLIPLLRQIIQLIDEQNNTTKEVALHSRKKIENFGHIIIFVKHLILNATKIFIYIFSGFSSDLKKTNPCFD